MPASETGIQSSGVSIRQRSGRTGETNGRRAGRRRLDYLLRQMGTQDIKRIDPPHGSQPGNAGPLGAPIFTRYLPIFSHAPRFDFLSRTCHLSRTCRLSRTRHSRAIHESNRGKRVVYRNCSAFQPLRLHVQKMLSGYGNGYRGLFWIGTYITRGPTPAVL